MKTTKEELDDLVSQVFKLALASQGLIRCGFIYDGLGLKSHFVTHRKFYPICLPKIHGT